MRLLAGDEAAFAGFVDLHYAALKRIAEWTAQPAVAGTLVQHAFDDFCRRLPTFGPTQVHAEVYRALLRALREHRRLSREDDPLGRQAFEANASVRSVSGERFLGPEHRWNGGWAMPPLRFAANPHAEPTGDAVDVLDRELEQLPLALRAIVVLRDVAGLSLDELVATLELPEQLLRRVLHCARSQLRAALEAHYRGAAIPQEVV